MKGLMIRGMAYSHTVSAIKGLVVTVLAPILVREHEITGIALVTLLMMTAVCAWCANLTAMIRSSYKGWRKHGMTYLVRWLSFGLLALLVTFWLESYAVLWTALILLMVLFLLSRKRLAMQGTFIADAREDAKTRVQLTEKRSFKPLANHQVYEARPGLCASPADCSKVQRRRGWPMRGKGDCAPP